MQYWDDTEGNSGYGLVDIDGKLMINFSTIYGPTCFKLFYDTETNEVFPGEIL